MAKVEIDLELLSDLVDAAGWVGNFFNDLQNGCTPEYHPDWGAAQYLASEAVLIEQRGRAVLEAVEHTLAVDDGQAAENQGRESLPVTTKA